MALNCFDIYIKTGLKKKLIMFEKIGLKTI